MKTQIVEPELTDFTNAVPRVTLSHPSLLDEIVRVGEFG